MGKDRPSKDRDYPRNRRIFQQILGDLKIESEAQKKKQFSRLYNNSQEIVACTKEIAKGYTWNELQANLKTEKMKRRLGWLIDQKNNPPYLFRFLHDPKYLVDAVRDRRLFYNGVSGFKDPDVDLRHLQRISEELFSRKSLDHFFEMLDKRNDIPEDTRAMVHRVLENAKDLVGLLTSALRICCFTTAFGSFKVWRKFTENFSGGGCLCYEYKDVPVRPRRVTYGKSKELDESLDSRIRSLCNYKDRTNLKTNAYEMISCVLCRIYSKRDRYKFEKEWRSVLGPEDDTEQNQIDEDGKRFARTGKVTHVFMVDVKNNGKETMREACRTERVPLCLVNDKLEITPDVGAKCKDCRVGKSIRCPRFRAEDKT